MVMFAEFRFVDRGVYEKKLEESLRIPLQNAGHDLAAVIQVRIIATVIALAIGFVFQTTLFEILIRAKNETLIRCKAAVLSLIGRMTSTRPRQVYEIRPRRDKQGVDLISDALPFGRLWYGEPTQSVMQSLTQSFAAVHMML